MIALMALLRLSAGIPVYQSSTSLTCPWYLSLYNTTMPLISDHQLSSVILLFPLIQVKRGLLWALFRSSLLHLWVDFVCRP